MATEIKNTNQSIFPRDQRSANMRPEKTNQIADASVKPRNSKKRQVELQEKTENDAKVDISNKIKDFSRIKKAADSAAEIDNSEKIANLKKQIDSGLYKINYDGLTDKIMEAESYGTKAN